MHLLADPLDALAARLALADAAEQSLDVQYYIWKEDTVGRLLLERLCRAADRGVRVRMLLDDIGTTPSDNALLGIDSHPNIEVRLFNPAKLRKPRLLGILIDFKRLNRRMHNKSFIADGQVAIVGGRNIGDEYFGAHATANFADVDVAVIGPVVTEALKAFDLYWNHPTAIPVAKVLDREGGPEQYSPLRAALAAWHDATTQTAYADTVRQSRFSQQLREDAVSFSWGPASVINDHPDKVLKPGSEDDTHIIPLLRTLARDTGTELYLVSPYFVPGKKGTELLSELSRRGVRVVVITNSLASTDGVPVHSHYRLCRRPLLEAGVELYELKATAGPGVKRRIGGSSGGSLHAKIFAFDRRILFIGSFNLDQRSGRLNTEMGVVLECPEQARLLPEAVDPDLNHKAYRVHLDRRRLSWTIYTGGEPRTCYSEPGASWGKRAMSVLLSLLPIEGLL